MHTIAEFLRSENPRYRDRLEEAHPQNGHTARGVEIHQLENINSTVRDHRNSEAKHYQTDSNGELDPMRTKYIRPVVDHTGYERFHDAKFTVDTEYKQHHEEYNGP